MPVAYWRFEGLPWLTRIFCQVWWTTVLRAPAALLAAEG